MKIGIIAVLVALNIICVYGATESINNSKNNQTPLVTEKTNTQAHNEEVIVLKAQLKTMQDFTQHILSTVYWSLGGIITLTFIIIGFNWFTIRRDYEKERKDHEKEVLNLKSELKRETTSVLNSFFEKTSLKIDESLKRAVESNFSALNRKYSNIEKLINEFKERQELEECFLKAELHNLQGIYANSLSYYFKALLLSITRENGSYKINSCLDKIIGTLKKCEWIILREVPEMMSILEKLPTNYSIQVSEIKGSLEKLEKI